MKAHDYDPACKCDGCELARRLASVHAARSRDDYESEQGDIHFIREPTAAQKAAIEYIRNSKIMDLPEPVRPTDPRRFAIEVEVSVDGDKVRHRVEGPTIEEVIALRNAVFPAETVDTPHVVDG